MSNDAQRIRSLTKVAGVAFRAAQSDMAKLLRRGEDLRRNLTQLTDRKATFARAQKRLDDPAIVAGADIRWHHWVDQRRATINTELAQVLAQKENARAKLRKAFGRDQATNALLRGISQKVQQDMRRRSDYES